MTNVRVVNIGNVKAFSNHKFTTQTLILLRLYLCVGLVPLWPIQYRMLPRNEPKGKFVVDSVGSWGMEVGIIWDTFNRGWDMVVR